jgi:uncharacterized protein
MPLTEHPSDNPITIQSITPEQIVINKETYTQSVLLTADFQIIPWSVKKLDDLTRALLEPLLQGNPELVLIGSGLEMKFLNPALMAVFYERGIGVEVMTTAAAARTYTVLTSENRKVGAVLII